MKGAKQKGCVCFIYFVFIFCYFFVAISKDELQAAVQAGEVNTERLRELQAKFGVTRLVALVC